MVFRQSFKAPVTGYTHFVKLGRWFLWGMILLVVGILFYIANDNATSDNARLVFSNIKQMENLQNIMKKPFYQGLDKDNMPYSISAKEAIQQDADTIIMHDIDADMETKDGKWMALIAGKGEFTDSTKMLYLTKDVDMFYEGGYEFRSESALIDVNNGTATGTQPIEGQGPMGTLLADRFAVSDHGNVIRFEGNVKMVIHRE